MTYTAHDFVLAYYSGDRKTGTLAVVKQQAGEMSVSVVASGADTGLEKAMKPIMIGMSDDKVVLLEPKTKALSLSDSFPADAFPAHVYTDPYSGLDWYMNDGDKETGNDTLNCGDKGSSVSVVENSNSPDAKYLATICVGRGHHQANFTGPSEQAPDVPRRAVISNLKDGTLTFIGSDPADTDTWLKVIKTVNLCEPDKEDGLVGGAVPNNSFPHGLVYSPVSGKLYNLNNGYGTIAIIDPASGEVEQRVNFKGHSNLFISKDGRYVIGRGADRKSDPDHVIAKLSVIDVTTNEVVDKMDLKDIYISKYFFNGDGSKLYLSTGSSGSDAQMANLKTDVVLVFDLSDLPKIKLDKELKLGSVGTLDFLNENGESRLVFSSDSTGGDVVILDGKTDDVVARISVNDGQPHSRLWMLG